MIPMIEGAWSSGLALAAAAAAFQGSSNCLEGRDVELPPPPDVGELTYKSVRHRWPTDSAGMKGIPRRSWPEVQPEAREIPSLERALMACRASKRTCDAERFVLATTVLGVDAARGAAMYSEGSDADSVCALGQCAQDGNGVEQSDAMAAACYRRAASLGHAQASYALGALYYVGDGVDEDEREAVRHFALAAQQRHPSAMYLLGDCLLEGSGVRPDRDAALRWLVAAGDLGHRGARSRAFAILDPTSMSDDASETWDPNFTDASRQTLRRRKTQQN